MQAIEKALDIHPKEIINDEKTTQNDIPPVNKAITPDEKTLLSVYREIGKTNGTVAQVLALKILKLIKNTYDDPQKL